MFADLLNANLAFFASHFLQGPPEPPYYGRFLIGQHHEDWARLVNAHDRLCVLAPRGHGKSEFYTVAYAIWQVMRPGGGSGLILSGGDDQALSQMRKIKTQIEENPKLAHLRPQGRQHARKWTDSHLSFPNGREIKAKSFMSKIRGAHPDWIVLDDVVNEESAFSPQMRRKVNRFFFSVVLNMVHREGVQIIVVGTPQASGDLYDTLSNPERGFHFQKFPALSPDAQGNLTVPLWPEVMDYDLLMRVKRSSGSLTFSRERMCEVVTDDSSIFPSSLFEQPDVKQSYVLGLPHSYWDAQGVTERYIGVDFAVSTSTGADYTVIFTLGLDEQGTRWIIDIERHKGLGFQDQLAHIRRAYEKYRPDLVYLESNQSQRIFGDELIRTSDVPVVNVHTGTEKHGLEKGLPALRRIFENRKYRVPRGDPHSVAMTDLWIQELSAHTWVDGKIKSTGAHDDTVMANFIAEKALLENRFSFAFGEQPEDKEAHWERTEADRRQDPSWLEKVEAKRATGADIASLGRTRGWGNSSMFDDGRKDGEEEKKLEDLLRAPSPSSFLGGGFF